MPIFQHPSRLIAAIAALAVATFGPPFAPAATRVLTFGGGPNPMLDQLSLESNVRYFRDVLARLGHADWRHDVYFADGGTGDRTVQYLVPRDDALRFRERLANLFTSEQANDVGLNVAFRKSDLADVRGRNDRDALTRWMDADGRTLGAGDRLFFYFTGHGSPSASAATSAGASAGGGSPQQRDTAMDVWGGPSIGVRQFAAELDKLDPRADVLLVMVQCFSGGFANVIYAGGDPARGLSPQVRLGFFSTVSFRIAAGCTSDVVGDDYREFSTAFFAALCGHTRSGKAIARPDYDGDGRTSLAEAFASVTIDSDTIDIPMTTRDLLLRDKSAFGPPAASRTTTVPSTAATTTMTTTKTTTTTRGPASRPAQGVRVAWDRPELLPDDAPFARVREVARPAERAMLDGLAKSLGLVGTDPLVEARAALRALGVEGNAFLDERAKSARQYGEAKARARATLTLRWPELANLWLPAASTVLSAHADEVRASFEHTPEYAAYVAASDQMSASNARGDALQRREAKLHRLIERAASVILAANLPATADAAVVRYHDALVAREDESL